MVLPTPNKGEKREDFIERCMGNPEANREFPDRDQRFAVCNSQWREAKSKNEATELRKRLKEDEDGFLFKVSDIVGASFLRREVDDGVFVVSHSEFHDIDHFFFDSRSHDFDSAIAWLKSIGIEPSDERQAELENRRMVMLEAETCSNFAQDETVKEVPSDVMNFLLVDAIAIAPGEHKGFKFDLDVIHKAVDQGKYNGARIVESHRFDEPFDVKGKITESKKDEKGALTTFFLFDDTSISKVKEGKFHSVSSNFLLEVDDDMNVTEITKVVELTLTGNPAVPEAVITNHADVNVEFENSALLEGIYNEIARLKSLFEPKEEFTVNSDEVEKTMSENSDTEDSIELEEELKEIRAQLEAARQEAEEAKKEAETALEREKRLESEKKELVLERKLAFAKTEARKLVDDGKVLPAQEEAYEQLYVAYSDDEDWKYFEQFIENNHVFERGTRGVQQSQQSDEPSDILTPKERAQAELESLTNKQKNLTEMEAS